MALIAMGAAIGGCYTGLDGAGPGVADGGSGEDEGDSSGSGGPSEIPEVGCDGLRPGPAPLRRMGDLQYRNTITDLFGGAVVASEDFPPTSSAFAFSSEPDANLVTALAAEQLLIAAEDIGDQVMAAVDELAPCQSAELGCAEAFVDSFGPRAFRRPLEDSERARLLAVFEAGSDEDGYAQGIGSLVTVALQMPAFLYFIEEGTVREGDTVQLSDHEIATRLSYLLWDTTPDEALRAAADDGALHDADAIETQTRRLLADPRSAPALTRFYREWLGARQLRPADKDAATFPDFDEAMIAAMDEQLERFVASSYAGSEPTLARLLTSGEFEVDATLAPLFGVENGGDWSPVDLPRRSGILTLPAYLGAHASAVETSAVFRGLEIRRRVLCQDIPPPPANAMENGTGLPEDATEAEKTEALINSAECGACHIRMNPLGMAFEHYDAMGAWRETYPGGEAIETQWELAFPPEGLEEATFDGAIELMALLAGATPVGDCFVSNFVHHSFGTAPAATEVAECELEDLSASFDASGQDLPELLVALTRSDAFRFRDLAEGED